MRTLVCSIVALAACGPCPPVSDVVVEGTTAEVGVVEKALSDLQAWTDRRSFCVAEVVVTDALAPGQDGAYEGATGQILLRRGQEHLYGTAVHESCHGIDKATGTASRFTEAFPYDPDAPDYAQRDELSRAREALARTCESGPINLHAVVATARACALDVPIEGASILLERFFEAWPEPEREPAVAVAVAEWAVPSNLGIVLPMDVAFTEGELRVAVVAPDGVRTAHLDPDSGRLVELTSAPLAAPATWPGDELPWSWQDVSVGTWADGSALVSFRQRLASGDEVPGLAGWDQGWTLPEPACVGEIAALVTVRGEPWLVEAEVGAVRWSRWARP